MSKKNSALPLSQLDKASRENIERITALHPHEMNVHDRAFMRARAEYLTSDQVADYVENDTLPALEEPEEEGGDDEGAVKPYGEWNLDELKEEVVARGVEITGNAAQKKSYVEALEADDAEEEETE